MMEERGEKERDEVLKREKRYMKNKRSSYSQKNDKIDLQRKRHNLAARMLQLKIKLK